MFIIYVYKVEHMAVSISGASGWLIYCLIPHERVLPI